MFPIDPIQSDFLENISYDSDWGMIVAWTMTTAMTRPLTLTLAGAMPLAEIRTMARICDSD